MKVFISFVLMLNFGCYAFQLPDFYHTTSELNNALNDISSKCSHITLSDALIEPNVKLVHIKRGEPKLKAFLLFGEHPRELISPETGINFLQGLCNDPNNSLLNNYELKVILNANPSSRERVENGEFCIRENEHGVDLNRNYAAHWQQIQDDQRQISSGPAPFSEPETQAIRDSLKSYNADLFLSIHSGTLGMYTPYAYTDADAEYNQDNMMDVLNEISEKNCPACDVGPAGREVGYLSPGSCIDYAYDELKIKYSFAIEIYHQDIDLQDEISHKSRAISSFLQMQESSQQRKQRIQQKLKNNNHSCFLETKSKSKLLLDDESCFRYFNPQAKDGYSWYVQNWTDAIHGMLTSVAKKELSTK